MKIEHYLEQNTISDQDMIEKEAFTSSLKIDGHDDAWVLTTPIHINVLNYLAQYYPKNYLEVCIAESYSQMKSPILNYNDNYMKNIRIKILNSLWREFYYTVSSNSYLLALENMVDGDLLNKSINMQFSEYEYYKQPENNLIQIFCFSDFSDIANIGHNNGRSDNKLFGADFNINNTFVLYKNTNAWNKAIFFLNNLSYKSLVVEYV